jgi:hypothetical protein
VKDGIIIAIMSYIVIALTLKSIQIIFGQI